ncbi:MAG: hypothetical protein MUP22_09250, partial [Desulfobacterales bacterium]|nr:hypothetical protein [Desulfobacterales bacterium]
HMGRIIQKTGVKGSLKWIQAFVNEQPHLLGTPIKKFIRADKGRNIEWLSPLANDDYSEYRDQAFLDLLGIELSKKKLKYFWPNRGPQWDALGRTGNEAYFLVEAKAHISEIISSCKAYSPKSKTRIKKGLIQTQKYLGLKPHIDFTRGLYQYANRLAHLYFLRVLNDIPAYLVFVFFIDDPTHISTSKAEWTGALQVMRSFLGGNNHKLSKYVIDVFVDVNNI